jgi:hypothetical protein
VTCIEVIRHGHKKVEARSRKPRRRRFRTRFRNRLKNACDDGLQDRSFGMFLAARISQTAASRGRLSKSSTCLPKCGAALIKRRENAARRSRLRAVYGVRLRLGTRRRRFPARRRGMMVQ